MKFETTTQFLKWIANDIDTWEEYTRNASGTKDEYKKKLIEKTQFFYKIQNPYAVLLKSKTMKQHKFWYVGEFLSEILSMNPPLMTRYKPDVIEWAYKLKDDNTVEYMYGRRWSEFNQFFNIIEILSKRLDSKRAVINIFTPYDTDPTRKDVPCTLMYTFKVRNNKINMTTFFRSHDLFSGWKYDILLSSFMLQLLTMAVNAKTNQHLQPGILANYEDSLHVYPIIKQELLSDFKKEFKMINTTNDMTEDFNIMYNYKSIKDIFKDLNYIKEVEEASYHNNFEYAKKLMNKILNVKFVEFADVFYQKNLKYYEMKNNER